MSTEEEIDDLGDYELGFVRGIFAGRGVTEPTEEDLRMALALLQIHMGATDALMN